MKWFLVVVAASLTLYPVSDNDSFILQPFRVSEL